MGSKSTDDTRLDAVLYCEYRCGTALSKAIYNLFAFFLQV